MCGCCCLVATCSIPLARLCNTQFIFNFIKRALCYDNNNFARFLSLASHSVECYYSVSGRLEKDLAFSISLLLCVDVKEVSLRCWAYSVPDMRPNNAFPSHSTQVKSRWNVCVQKYIKRWLIGNIENIYYVFKLQEWELNECQKARERCSTMGALHWTLKDETDLWEIHVCCSRAESRGAQY